MSRLQTIDPNLQILPATTHKSLNPITGGKNIPVHVENFKKYFSNMTFSNTSVSFYARVQTNKRVNQHKREQMIFEYLKQHHIWMKYNQLSSNDITAVDWVYDKHPDAISTRHDLIGEMSQLLPSKFKEFQLTARIIPCMRGSELKTRGWVIEMSREAAKAHFGEFIKTFNPQARITIVPLMDPKLWDRNGAAESFYLGQKKMLYEAVVLKVDGLQGLDEFHEDENGNTPRTDPPGS